MSKKRWEDDEKCQSRGIAVTSGSSVCGGAKLLTSERVSSIDSLSTERAEAICITVSVSSVTVLGMLTGVGVASAATRTRDHSVLRDSEEENKKTY